MKIFGKEEPRPVSLSAVENIVQNTNFRLEPTFEEVADYAKRHKLYSTTEKLLQAHRECRKWRLQLAIQHCGGDGLMKAVMSEIIDLL